MIGDARNVADGARLQTEVCIVGAGAAGITLAREFGDGRFRVMLLEAGGEAADPQSQAIYRGESVGHVYYPLESSRLRFFGGTTNHWGGMSIPFDPIDFEYRDWVPNSGWPISHTTLAPYIARAHEVCEIGRVEYGEDYWGPKRAKPPFPIRGEDLIPRIAQFSPPTRFGQRYRADLEAEHITTLLSANVVEIVPERDGRRIERVRVATFGGTHFEVAANIFIVATGAVENARLLLASRSRVSPGIGNAHDLVGRYFMERVNRRSGVLVPTDPAALLPFFEQDRIGNMGVNGYLGTSPAWQKRERTLNSSIHLHRAGTLQPPDVEGGRAALRRIRRALERGEAPDELAGDLWKVLQDLDEIIAERWDRWRGSVDPEEAVEANAAGPVLLDVWHDVEPVPNPASRVKLGDERDALGMPRVVLDWKLTPELEGATIRRAAQLLAREAGRAGAGRVRIDIAPEGDDWVPEVVGSFHQMGTTRMSAEKAQGVVDADCRVHGIANLYLAGSSVFTTAGQANPTICLLALALRLADHVRAEFE